MLWPLRLRLRSCFLRTSFNPHGSCLGLFFWSKVVEVNFLDGGSDLNRGSSLDRCWLEAGLTWSCLKTVLATLGLGSLDWKTVKLWRRS